MIVHKSVLNKPEAMMSVWQTLKLRVARKHPNKGFFYEFEIRPLTCDRSMREFVLHYRIVFHYLNFIKGELGHA